MQTNTTTSTPCVLLLEENLQIRKMTQAMLELLGVHCISALSSDEALKIFEKGCDLVLLDLSCANTRNFSLAKQMRELEQPMYKHTPIIGNTMEVNLKKLELLSLDAQIDCAYPKIHNLQELYFILSEWLNHPFSMPNNYFFSIAA